MNRLKKTLIEEDLLTSFDDELLCIDPVSYKEIRNFDHEDLPDKFFVFNTSHSQNDDIDEVYNSQIFKIAQLTSDGKLNISDEDL